jgi:hypothetical protein
MSDLGNIDDPPIDYEPQPPLAGDTGASRLWRSIWRTHF